MTAFLHTFDSIRGPYEVHVCNNNLHYAYHTICAPHASASIPYGLCFKAPPAAATPCDDCLRQRHPSPIGKPRVGLKGGESVRPV